MGAPLRMCSCKNVDNQIWYHNTKRWCFSTKGKSSSFDEENCVHKHGGVFNLKYLSGKTPGRKSKLLFFPIITPGSILNGGNIFIAHNKLWEGNVFTPVCDSVYRGVSVQGVSVQKWGLCSGRPPPLLILVLLDFLFSRVKTSNANIGITANFV